MSALAPPVSALQNGLADAVGCPPVSPIPGIGAGSGGLSPQNFAGLPGASGYTGSEPVAGSRTMEKNLRYYLITNFRTMLSQAYAEIGLLQTVVDVPVDDALRGGVDIKSGQLNPDQLEDLRIALERDDDLNTAGTAAKWARLYGGGAVLIMSDADPETPFDIDEIEEGEDVEFRAADMWELSMDGRALTDGDGSQIEGYRGVEFYTYYGQRIHHSRVLRVKGKEAPSFIRPQLRGWGLSVCETLMRSVNQYLKATDLSFEVLDEFKLDIYRIKNLVNTLMAPNGDEAVRKRIGIANWQKNYQNAVVLDAEDEYDNKQLSFTGLADAMAGIRMQVAADMRMPITKLFGQSVSGGIGNNDQNDMENYNGMVESQVRGRMKRDILRMIEIKCQILFGYVPDDLSISFKPLRVLSAVDEENVKSQKFARVLQARQAGELTAKEFRDACNKGALVDITLETDDAIMQELEEENEPPQIEGGAPGGGQIEASSGARQRKDGQPDGRTTRAKTPETPKLRAVTNAEFKEADHPRADDGKFSEGGGSGKAGGENKTPAVKKPKYEGLDKDTETKISKYLDKTGKFSSAVDTVRLNENAGHGPIAASYNYATKTINLNPAALNSPGVTVDKVIGHELGHGVMSGVPYDKQIEFAKNFGWKTAEVAKDKDGKIIYASFKPKTSLKPKKGWEHVSHYSTSNASEAFAETFEAYINNPEKLTSEMKKFFDDLNYSDYESPMSKALKAKNGMGVEQPVTSLTSYKSKKKKKKKYAMAKYYTTNLQLMPAAYTAGEKIKRAFNSMEFDRASYLADGGDTWIDSARQGFFDDGDRAPMGANVALWLQAQERSREVLGSVRWQFVAWWYKKQGGKFQ